MNGIEVNGLILCHKSLTEKETTKLLGNSFDEQSFSCPSFDSNVRCDKSKLAVSFDSTECQNEELCGGKGASLGFLTTLKSQSPISFEVPNGFVLTSTAFLLQLKRHQQLDTAISVLENIAYQRVSGALQEACTNVCDLFKFIEIDEEIAAAIAMKFTALKQQSDGSFRVAVRSSAMGEDGTESSAAGQNATYLGVSDLEQTLTAVRNCWASLFTMQSLSYRLQNIQPIRTQMAVVVQTMVPSEAAGVLFTHLPLNNDPNRLLITANFGLGEVSSMLNRKDLVKTIFFLILQSVVSGTVDPDVFVVLRGLRNNNLTIVDRKMGDKATRIEMNATDHVDSADNDHIDRKKYCVNDEHLLALCQIGIYLENCYRSARDIEWALHNVR